MGFLAELKRRRVYRAATVYAAVGFVIIQAADVIFPRLAIPDWATSLVIIVVILGLPIALVLAWALELTPEGLRKTTSVSDDSPAELPAPLGSRTVAIAAGLVLLGIGLGAGWFLKPVTKAAPPQAASAVETDNKSIAVLPFEDLSPGSDQEWFSDGLTEEILNSLARLGEMRVTARNSSFQFKNQAVDVREIGRRLGVANVLEGSVRRAGDQLRITAQLIRAADGIHLWSNTYTRNVDDVFAVQQDIAENIARVLDVYLDEERRARMFASGTRHPEAFLHYLRGRAEYNMAHQLGLGTNDRLWQANAWFERALAVDSAYVVARFYHHDAIYHALMKDIAVPPELLSPDGQPDVRRLEELLRADLDGAIAGAGDTPLGRSLAIVRHYLRGEWERLPAAIAAFDEQSMMQEVEISAGGWLWFPLMLARADSPLAQVARLRLERDPLDVAAWSDLIGLELLHGRMDEVRRLTERGAALGISHRYLEETDIKLMIATGRAREVLARYQAQPDSGGLAPWAMAMAHAALGDTAAVRAVIDREGLEAWQSERRCWILALISDQRGANECARAIDAQPLGWVRLARGVVDHGSIAFDAEAAPRFSARYAALGATPWPRTRPFHAPAP
jgi:TolB-like protein